MYKRKWQFNSKLMMQNAVHWCRQFIRNIYSVVNVGFYIELHLWFLGAENYNPLFRKMNDRNADCRGTVVFNDRVLSL